MSYRVTDIMYETPTHWVLDDRKGKCYTVLAIGVTHSTSDSSYPHTDDSLGIAVARCYYLTKRAGYETTDHEEWVQTGQHWKHEELNEWMGRLPAGPLRTAIYHKD